MTTCMPSPALADNLVETAQPKENACFRNERLNGHPASPAARRHFCRSRELEQHKCRHGSEPLPARPEVLVVAQFGVRQALARRSGDKLKFVGHLFCCVSFCETEVVTVRGSSRNWSFFSRAGKREVSRRPPSGYFALNPQSASLSAASK